MDIIQSNSYSGWVSNLVTHLNSAGFNASVYNTNNFLLTLSNKNLEGYLRGIYGKQSSNRIPQLYLAKWSDQVAPSDALYSYSSHHNTTGAEDNTLDSTTPTGTLKIMTTSNNDKVVWIRGANSAIGAKTQYVPSFIIVQAQDITDETNTTSFVIYFNNDKISTTMYYMDLGSDDITYRDITLSNPRMINVSDRDSIVPIIFKGTTYIANNLFYFSNVTNISEGVTITDGLNEYLIINAGGTTAESIVLKI